MNDALGKALEQYGVPVGGGAQALFEEGWRARDALRLPLDPHAWEAAVDAMESLDGGRTRLDRKSWEALADVALYAYWTATGGGSS